MTFRMTLFLHSLLEKDLKMVITKMKTPKTRWARKHMTFLAKMRKHPMLWGHRSDNCEAGKDALKNLKNRVAEPRYRRCVWRQEGLSLGSPPVAFLKECS